jgi:hypothetical protein
MKEYFHGGATWTVAPKPLMDDALYDKVIRVFIISPVQTTPKSLRLAVGQDAI